jgi:hypothetical protein
MSAEGRSRAVAAAIVLVIHGAVTWVLLRTPRHPGENADAPVLRVRWIESLRPAPPASPRPTATRPSSSSLRLPPSLEAGRSPTSQASGQPPPEAVTSTPAPDYLAQGAAWATETAPAVDFRPGLTASRVPTLPGGTNGGQFRMREPTSPKRTLEKTVGWLFGGPNYTTDPCPRMHENVYGLLPDTSDEGRQRLAWELREYRERCRP